MTAPGELRRLAWPVSRLAHAVEALCRRRSDLAVAGAPEAALTAPAPDRDLRGAALGRWVEATCDHLGLEAEELELGYADLPALLRSGAPALVRLPGAGEEPRRFLVLAGARGAKVELLTPDLGLRRVPREAVRRAICSDLEDPQGEQVDALLDRAGVPRRRQARARSVLLADRLARERLGEIWLVRLPPGHAFAAQLRQARLPRGVMIFLAAHLAQYVMLLGAWWLVGRGALQGALDRGWLWAWALLLVTMVPLALLVRWTQGRVALGVGGLLKRRLLHGAMRLEPDEIRSQGAGQLLGRVMESDAVESLALGAGFQGVVALLELGLAAAVLAMGASGAYLVPLLLAWTIITGALAWRYHRRASSWTGARLGLTHELVERMVGHRTRLAQQERAHWHDGEDEALERYTELSRRLDGAGLVLAGVPQRGWLLLALAGLAPSFVAGGASTAAVAVALGGVLLASGALAKVEESLTSVSATLLAWRQVRELYHAAGRAEERGATTALAGEREPAPEREPAADDDGPARRVLEAQRLTFRYRPGARDVLDGCDLTINRGDRVLLEGPSGGGKSTLAAVITGLRRHQEGLLLLNGLDRQSVGVGTWRRRVVSAPQFHENHVFTGTLSFNLLMGRRWPPTADDLERAEDLCRELGLGDLLDRMPAGMNQVVGDTGWRLSHGEQSRLFMARALLQDADLVVLDESFAALDPESLGQAMRCVIARAPALLVIAHP